jgi:pimeloyl-ACP methyl ester carboxylesterase
MSNLRTMTLHGDRVAYRDEGTGEPLLLIHGMGNSSVAWRSVIPRLSKKYRVIAPDLPGHGQSDKRRGDYSLGAFAVQMRDLLEALDIPQATVVGHSLGGGVAMQFAYQHREYCRRLVLISSGGLGSDVGVVLRILSLPGAELVLPLLASWPMATAGNMLWRWAKLCRGEAAAAEFGEVSRAHSSLSNRNSRQAFLRTLRSVVDHRGQAVCALNLLHVMAGLPALIISGDADRMIPVAHAHAGHAALPGSRLHVLRGVGHHPPVECPHTVAALIDDFIDKTGEHNRADESRRVA